MKNTLININGEIIDARFISNITLINFNPDTHQYEYKIKTLNKTVKICRNIEEDYDTTKKILYEDNGLSMDSYIKMVRYRPELIHAVFGITKTELEKHREYIVELRNTLLDQDDSCNYIEMDGFKIY